MHGFNVTDLVAVLDQVIDASTSDLTQVVAAEAEYLLAEAVAAVECRIVRIAAAAVAMVVQHFRRTRPCFRSPPMAQARHDSVAAMEVRCLLAVEVVGYCCARRRSCRRVLGYSTERGWQAVDDSDSMAPDHPLDHAAKVEHLLERRHCLLAVRLHIRFVWPGSGDCWDRLARS